MKKRILLLFLLLLLPFVKVNALSADDLKSNKNGILTTPRTGYRCYVVCQTAECRTKMVLYTNRDMTAIKTYEAKITENGTKEDPVDGNAGLNLFADTIKYPDTYKNEFHNIYHFYSKALDGGFDLGNKNKWMQEKMIKIQDTMKAKLGNKYPEFIEQVSNYKEDSNVSPYACIMATDVFYEVASSGGSFSVTVDSHFIFVFEDDYDKGKRSVYNLAYGTDITKYPNLDDWIMLEGTGFLIVTRYDLEGADFVRLENVFSSPKYNSDEVTGTDVTQMSRELNKDEKSKVKTFNNSIDEILNNGEELTHDKLIEALDCITPNHDIEEINKLCEAEIGEPPKAEKLSTADYAIELIKYNSKWKKCAQAKGYVWSGACKNGYTIGVLPMPELAKKAQQETVNSYTSNGKYKFAKAAFDLVASDVAMSCHDIRFLTYIWRAICILAPFLVIIFGSLDYIKAIMAGDEKAQKDATKKLPKRIIAFVVFLILPILIRLIFRIGAYTSGNMGLLNCVVNFDTKSTKPIHRSNAKKISCDTIKGVTADECRNNGCEVGEPSKTQTGRFDCKAKADCTKYVNTCPKIAANGDACIEDEVETKNKEGKTVKTKKCIKNENAKSCDSSLYDASTCPLEPKTDDYGKICVLRKLSEKDKKPSCDYKRKCTEFTDTCPEKDDYNKECKLDGKKCDYKKKCTDYGYDSCKQIDDYGKTCKAVLQGTESGCTYRDQ